MAVMLISGRKDEDQAADIIDIPKRTTPAKGKERPKFECAVCIIQQRETVKEICICPERCGFFCIYSCCLYLPLITFAPCPAISLGLVPVGYELLYQPEVVRIYTSLLKESKNPTVLEASAGAVQNLCAGRWTVRTAIHYSPVPFHSTDATGPNTARVVG